MTSFRLERVRSAGELVADGLRVWMRHLGLFLAIGAVIAVPVEVLLPGVLGGRLWGPFDPDAPFGAGAAGPTSIVFSLFVAPATLAASAAVLIGLADGRAPRLREALGWSFERVGDAVVPIVVAALGALLGLVALIAPGIYLYVRWYLIVPAVLVERVSGLDSLRRSSAIVAGQWWRTFGCFLLTLAVCAVPLFTLFALGLLAGYLTGYEAMVLAAETIGDVLFFPLFGIMTTLLYFDLRARKGEIALLQPPHEPGPVEPQPGTSTTEPSPGS